MIKQLYNQLLKVKNKKRYIYFYRGIKIFLNIFYPVYCKYSKSHREDMGKSNVIISLTSFPARIDKVWIVIETLLRQTCQPEKIILWLADSQFDTIDKLPAKLLKQKARGLEIKFCDDLRSHKKYYYAMKNYPESIIITVDDDMFYPENLVEELLNTHKSYPNCICCNLAHLITVEEGRINSYKKWKSGADGYDKPSDYLVPIGCEGVLYPPGCLNENVFDIKQINELCPYADDLWLKAMATINNIKAIKCSPISISYVNLFSTNKSSLNSININQDMNDKQLNNILALYPQLYEKWK